MSFAGSDFIVDSHTFAASRFTEVTYPYSLQTEFLTSSAPVYVSIGGSLVGTRYREYPVTTVFATATTVSLILPTDTGPTYFLSSTLSYIPSLTNSYFVDIVGGIYTPSSTASSTARLTTTSFTRSPPSAAPASITAVTHPPSASSALVHSKDLSGGAIAGVVVGSIAGLVLIIALFAYFLRTRKRIRQLLKHPPTEQTAFEKAELPASRTTWWDRLQGKRKVELLSEMPATNETRVRAELPGTAVEPQELPTEGSGAI